ncbi:hypothetical protein [Arabiibacter massiliensis]|uniref:hypothetical protein n=1 Tax=Arabiibacter massiliensis TaxID=1870985 RepID=UPI00117A9391|nr:hypothetical protein [Arabiibacter massiliensis]
MLKKVISLAAMDENFAYFSVGWCDQAFSPRDAAVDLMKVRTWTDLVRYLEKHASNRDVAWFFPDDGCDSDKVFSRAPEFDSAGLGRPLQDVLSKDGMPDYCDHINELTWPYYVVSIREVIHLRDSLRGLARLAAVALGSPYYGRLITFEELDNGRIEGCINPETAGCTRHGLIDEELVLGGSAPVILGSSIGELYLDGETFIFDERAITREDATKIACGHFASRVMGSMGQSIDLETMQLPDHVGEEGGGYGFTPEEGFFYHDPPSSVPWWEGISNEVVSAILHGRVAVCENCKTPFIAERKGAKTCSQACRTELCIKRKVEANPVR